MRKFLAAPAVAAFVGVALLLAGCSPSSNAADDSASSGPVTISLESYLPTLGDVGVKTAHQLIDNFQKANPGITVNFIPDNNAGAAAQVANYQREAATNAMPDVGQVVFDTLRFAVNGLGAQPLDTVYGAEKVTSLFGGQYPFAAPVTKLGVVNGHTYGVPWTLSTPVMFYNPDLLKKAGIAAPPATWDDLSAAAPKLKALGSTALANGCIGTANGGNDWCLQAILASNGGSVLNSDGSKTTFDDAANVKALTTMQGLQAGGALVDLTTQQAVQQFSSGKVAMLLTSAALQTTLLNAIGTQFTLQNAPMPGFTDKTATPTNSGSALMVFSKDKAKQAAAWKLINYLAGPEAETIITTQVGYPPLRPSLASADNYLKPFATQHPLLAVNLAQLDRIIPWQSYPGNNFIQVETLLCDTTTKIVFQGQDAASSLKSAQSQAAGLVG